MMLYRALYKVEDKFPAEVLPMNPESDNFDEEWGEYYWYDYELYHSKKFAAEMEEIFAEEAYLTAHPEERRIYTSTKEILRDIGLDVSNIPDR